jgi:Rha family phage regulatory protein
MYDLTIIKQNGGCYIDSREVAALIGKAHKNLLRDIAGYIGYMQKTTELNFEPSAFFANSTYLDSTGRTLPCYLISKMGCELVANKLTGEKGVLFTVAYVTKFNALEAAERAELEARASMPIPRLGEYNAAARLIVRAMRNIGATSEQVIAFIKSVYEPLGFSVAPAEDIAGLPETFSATQIAAALGIYSVNGNPHSQAVACILNENLFIGDEHKSIVAMDYGNHIGVCVRYDESALNLTEDFIQCRDYPNEIDGLDRTYHVVYKYKKLEGEM